MNNRVLDISRFEYHDNVAVDNFQDMRKKEIIVYFDYYNYDDSTGIKMIEKPIQFVIDGWSKVLYHNGIIKESSFKKFVKTFTRRWPQKLSAQKLYDEKMNVVFHDLGEKTIRIFEILNMKQCGRYMFLHVEGELDGEEFIGFLKFYDVNLSLEEMDMSQKRNTFLEIDEIEELEGKEPFVVNIPKVTNKDDLLNSLRKKLQIPDNILCTWNNLAKCLSNIYWIGCLYYVIIHEDLSDMSKEDLDAYFEVIRKCQYRTLRTFFVLDKYSYDKYDRSDSIDIEKEHEPEPW